MDRVLDAKSLRGLAHPLRVRLLGMLRTDGPATATQLAERVGERSGTTSWHLRQLAEHGFVEEDTERGNRRERWWRAVHEHTVLDTDELGQHAESRGALEVYLHEVVTTHYHDSAAFLAERQQWSRAWIKASSLSDTLLSLTPEELSELTRRIHGLLDEFRRPAEDGDEQVSFQFQAFPRSRP
ncbi:helix-turn-helix domain-containing protein [Saccharopolyspora sp. K220]|uniref:ArsR/SmtB family transcription factor n=1 Tax=Saccharopolyspora soli TaxID=2926618 RepID=UPI001F58804B|nr:helix-turn-helix domain-containing protein [Saccharopolyspora soli]MCI2423041.1 helix-turn-helix domain-containing protein [Saccharopolyspora soli]